MPSVPMPRSAFFKSVAKTFETGMKLKLIMAKRGISKCRCVCPECGKMIYASLDGPHDHLRMKCSTDGCMEMME